jgi:DNA-binding response OmpR family regulator
MAGQKILIVDDDPNLLRLVELILRREQYEVITAVTGESAIDKAREFRPDLILMDVMLPGIDGFQATRQIRQLPEGGTIPILFLSAADTTEAKVKGLRGGGNDYITKPVKTGELLARIEAHLRPSGVNVGQAIVVFGSRPGAGATTLTVNLALALRQTQQKKVFIVDWQRPLGDVAFMLGMPEVRSLDFILSHAQKLDEDTLMSLTPEYAPGLWVVPGATSNSVAAQMSRKALTTVMKTALLKADYVLIDAGTFFAWEEPPLIARGEGINVCVLTPEPIALRRALQAKATAGERDCVLWFVLNQPVSPATGMAGMVEAQLETSLHGTLPDGRSEREDWLKSAPPFYARDSRSNYAEAIDRLVERMAKVS